MMHNQVLIRNYDKSLKNRQEKNHLCATPTYFTHQHRDVMKQLYIDIFMHKILGGYLVGPRWNAQK